MNLQLANTISKFMSDNFHILWNVTDPLINILIFVSLCYRKKVHDKKEFSHGNSKPSSELQIMTHYVKYCK